MVVIDLKIFSGGGHTSASLQKEMADELWSYHVLPVDGLRSCSRFPTVRKALQRQLQDQELLLLGPVPLHGLCPAVNAEEVCPLFAGIICPLYVGIKCPLCAGLVKTRYPVQASPRQPWEEARTFPLCAFP